MTWHVVPNLEELRDQMNVRFPNRDKSSDGSIGDTSHAARASSHNPDLTGSPEYRDGDAKDEVRARDFDADLRDSNGVTMERVVQHLVEMARAGRLPHLEYIIFNKRIWTKGTGWTTRTYTGSNPHDKHAHVNSGFNQAADNATGVDWALNEIGSPAAPPPVVNHPVLKRGDKGDAVRHTQMFFRNVFPSYRNYVNYKRYQLITVDGDYGYQTEAWVKEFQRRTDLTQDGVVGPKTLTAMRKFGYKY
jgi:putative peptidoglycan binding protein